MEPVLTHRAKTVVDAARLHRARDRSDRGLTLVEGPDLVADAIASGATVVEIFATPGSPVLNTEWSSDVTVIDERALQRLSGTKTPRGPVAVVEIPEERLDPTANLLVAVGVSDPGNVGTMIRTAAAFGWGFAYTTGAADPWSPKTIRAGGGGQFQTAIASIDSMASLAGWSTVATIPRGGVELSDLPNGHYAVLIGEEAHGLRADDVASADLVVSITTPGPTESLNAAVAAAIVVHEISNHSSEPGTNV